MQARAFTKSKQKFNFSRNTAITKLECLINSINEPTSVNNKNRKLSSSECVRD